MSRDFEQEARSQGWVPEDEFTGDNPPAEFVDAETFVERGEKINGVLKKQLTQLNDKVDNLQQSNAEFGKYHKQTLAKERQERETLIKELEAKRETAINEADGQTFTQVERQLETLKEPQEDPLAQAWVSNNNWYQTDPKLTAYADGVAGQIVSEGYTGQAYYTELTRRVKETFPDEFNTNPPPVVESGQDSKASPKAQSYEALPADARDQCERFVRDIPGFTKEQYVADYEWD